MLSSTTVKLIRNSHNNKHNSNTNDKDNNNNNNQNTIKTQLAKPSPPESPSSAGAHTPANSEPDCAAAESNRSTSTSLHSPDQSAQTVLYNPFKDQAQETPGLEMLLTNLTANSSEKSKKSSTTGPGDQDFGPIGQKLNKMETPPSLTNPQDMHKMHQSHYPHIHFTPFSMHYHAKDFGNQASAVGAGQNMPRALHPTRQPYGPGCTTPFSFFQDLPSSPSSGTIRPSPLFPASNHSSEAYTSFLNSPSPSALHGPRAAPFSQPTQSSPLQQIQAQNTVPVPGATGVPSRLEQLRSRSASSNTSNNIIGDNNSETFRPMHTVRTRYNSGAAIRQHAKNRGRSSSVHAISNIMNGFSPNYQGDTSLANNRSASIPESESCSLFILGLPPTLTTKQLLGAIRNVGRVWASHINLPEPSRGHTTCAAKVIFFEREAAQRFYTAHQPHNGGFVTDPASGLPPARVLWNRIRSAEVAPAPAAGGAGTGGNKSRVLLIYGPKRLVNEAWLTAYFASKMEFQIDEALELASSVEPVTSELMVLFEYRFGSFRCQAEAAKMSLGREFRDEIKVWYGEDPCAPGVVGSDSCPELVARGQDRRVAMWPRPMDLQSRNFQF